MIVRSGSALGRLAQRSSTAEERCDLCSSPMADTHRHILDLRDDLLRCACQACALLFEREAAARGHYRLVPQRRLRLADHDVDAGVPVGLAFFVVRPDGSVTAHYPSPVGATSAEVDVDAWQAMTAHWPELSGLAPSVEALLVNATRGHNEHWIVPIDDCYRLIAVLREHWTGFSGGREVWPAVDRFFAGLGAPARGRITVASAT